MQPWLIPLNLGRWPVKNVLYTHTLVLYQQSSIHTHTQTWHKNTFLLAHSRCQWCDRTINCIVFPDPYQTHIDSFRDSGNFDCDHGNQWLIASIFQSIWHWLGRTWSPHSSQAHWWETEEENSYQKIQILKQVKPIENVCFSILKEITVLNSNSQMF